MIDKLAKECTELLGNMRDATKEERDSIICQFYFRRYWNKILGNIREGKGEIEMRDEDCLIVAFDRCEKDGSLLMVSRRTKDDKIHIVNLIRDNAEGLYLRLTKGE